MALAVGRVPIAFIYVNVMPIGAINDWASSPYTTNVNNTVYPVLVESFDFSFHSKYILGSLVLDDNVLTSYNLFDSKSFEYELVSSGV